jgi:hypothetical protein
MTKVSMSSVDKPKGHEHIGDELFTCIRCREWRGPISDYPLIPHSSEEEEEAQREVEQRAEFEV